jgi:hypothetical protein
MKLVIAIISSFLFTVAVASEVCRSASPNPAPLLSLSNSTNGCVNLTIGQGTGCAWMCNYCATNLGTNNYYFTGNPPVCVYQQGQGCVGSPSAGQTYTCCSV